VQAFQVLPMLRSLDALYPDFSHWYVNTVVPGVVLGQDALLLAKDGDQVVGVALGKRTPARPNCAVCASCRHTSTPGSACGSTTG